MKLWKISQTVNDNYDTYDSAIIAAETEDEAKNIHPDGRPLTGTRGSSTWVKSSKVTAKLIGEAAAGTEAGVILASFNAG